MNEQEFQAFQAEAGKLSGTDNAGEAGADAQAKAGDDANAGQSAQQGDGKTGAGDDANANSSAGAGSEDDSADLDLFEGAEDAGDDSAGDDSDDDVPEEDRAMISKVVDKKLAKITKELQESKRENAINNFLTSEEGQVFKQFEPLIRKYANDKKLSHIKIQALAYMVAGKKLLQIGGKKGIEAYKDAKGAMVGGNQSRQQSPTMTEDSIRDMPKDQFRQFWNKVKNQPRQ